MTKTKFKYYNHYNRIKDRTCRTLITIHFMFYLTGAIKISLIYDLIVNSLLNIANLYIVMTASKMFQESRHH